jgi:hypothetical protein
VPRSTGIDGLGVECLGRTGFDTSDDDAEQ